MNRLFISSHRRIIPAKTEIAHHCPGTESQNVASVHNSKYTYTELLPPFANASRLRVHPFQDRSDIGCLKLSFLNKIIDFFAATRPIHELFCYVRRRSIDTNSTASGFMLAGERGKLCLKMIAVAGFWTDLPSAEALDDLDTAIEFNPTIPLQHTRQSVLHDGILRDAFAYLDTALETTPANGFDRGRVYYTLSRLTGL
ncbi:10391_t:CDS:2 [Paraglomus occultum]|uniref:10391_t:CDS:1 n=1 Tax=Paraglomus occultum TaxID=144539 RepID=A0A9N9EXI1_9GLOM|nr:10391_t:CDS:2 [Paraglomus occultum]